MAQAINNTNMETIIREAVEKYCNDYYCTDTFTVS